MAQTMRFCIGCKELLDIDKFNLTKCRNLCKAHANKRGMNSKNLKWNQNPLGRRSYVIWQIAYIDCRKTFQIKMELKPSQVLKLMESNKFGVEDDIRLVPMDPVLPLSETNVGVVNSATKYDLCFNFRRLRSRSAYQICFDPRCVQSLKRQPSVAGN